MKRINGSNNLYRKFILQYSLLAIILLSLSISCILYSMLQSSNERQSASNQAFLDAVAEKLDAQFLIMNTSAMRFASDTTLSGSALTSTAAYITAKNNYRKYTYPLHLLETSLLFYGDEDTCILASSGVFRREYFDVCFAQYGLTLETLEQYTQGLKKQRWFYLPETRNMVYAYPLHYIDNQSMQTLFFVLNADTLFQSLEDGFSGEDTLYTISLPEFTLQKDASGEIEVLDAAADAPHLFQRSLQNVSMRLMVSSPPATEWFPINLFLLIVGMLTVIASLLVFLLSRSAYQPIQSLVTQLTQPKHRAKKADLSRKYEDLNTIQDTFDQVLSDRHALMKQLEKQSQLIYPSVLLKILHGSDEDTDAETLRKIMKLDPRHTLYRLVYVMLDHVERVGEGVDYTALSFLQDAVLRVLHRLAGENDLSVAMTSFLQGKCAVMLIASEPDFSTAFLGAQMGKLQQIIQDSLSQTVTLVLGSPFERLSEAKHAYHQLCECAQWRIFTGWNALILQESPPQLPGDDQEKKVRASDVLALCRIPDEAGARDAMRSYFIQQCEGPDEILFRATYYRVFGQLQNAVDSEEKVEYLREPETLDQVLEYLGALIHTLCEQSRRRESSGRVRLLEQARQMLDQDYADSQLSTSSVAAVLGISEGYLRQEFKRQFGMSISAYLDEVRMRHVKHLLVNTDLSVKEIVDQTGFADSSNFIRKFKHAEGETPISYRNRLKDNGK